MGRGAVEKGGNAPWATDLSTEIKILRKLPLLLVYVYCQEVVPYWRQQSNDDPRFSERDGSHCVRRCQYNENLFSRVISCGPFLSKIRETFW